MTVRSQAALAAALTLFGSVLLSRHAGASQHDFPFSYDWKQAAPGEKEIETHSTYLTSDRSFEEEVEFEYGASQRFTIAPYLVLGRGPGESLRYTGFQVETRYQLQPYKTGRLLSGLYEEYAQPKGERASLESRLVLSRYDAQGGDLTFNAVLTNSFRGSPDYEKTYSFGYARPLSARSRYAPRGGAEFIHSVTDGRLNLGPILGLAPSRDTWIVAGYAFALNGRANNRGELRVIAEYEF